ncbi:Sialin [Chionoecetes opilio]|uniref:Sialin n=1 Tax=Chionoecetes opilio TaxID=41210 RepID=A0A8J4YGJ8_CHIOP|nr:Sialin [Chionoecetes opilio]
MEKEKGLTTLYSRTMGRVPARLVLAGMSMLGFINLYMVRLNLSVILVTMVRRNVSLEANTAPCLRQVTSNASLGGRSKTAGKAGKHPEKGQPFVHQIMGGHHVGRGRPRNPTLVPGGRGGKRVGGVSQEGEMDWSETVQGFVLGSFYYGYATSQIIGGRSAELYGSRWVFGGSILAGGVASILTPVASRIHYGLLITVRLLQGICQVHVPLHEDQYVKIIGGQTRSLGLPDVRPLGEQSLYSAELDVAVLYLTNISTQAAWERAGNLTYSSSLFLCFSEHQLSSSFPILLERRVELVSSVAVGPGLIKAFK